MAMVEPSLWNLMYELSSMSTQIKEENSRSYTSSLALSASLRTSLTF